MTAVVLLCAGGWILSALSLSGTWLVLLAAAVAAWVRPGPFPGVGTLVGFGVLCLLVEGAEAVAGAIGVRRRGGSAIAGMAAIGGGLLGLLVGSVLIPIPVCGSLLGMLSGSFALTYIVEYRRLRAGDAATRIALGTVIARVIVIFIKGVVTIGMTTWLAVGILHDSG
jgi:uncharacterized protein YqgC (DUF456 family)